MIEEKAFVESSDGGQVTFRIIRTGACDACSIREQCYRNDGVVSVPRSQVQGLDGAAVASTETVKLRIPNTSVLRLTGLVYGLPLVAFFAGLLLGYYLIFPGVGENMQALGSFVTGAALLGLAGFGIYRFDRRVARAVRYVVEGRGRARPA